MALSNAERQAKYRERLRENEECYRFQMWLSKQASGNLYKLSERSGRPLKEVVEIAINRLAQAYQCNK